MPRALTAEWIRVERPERDGAIEQWRRRREHYAAEGCRFWVFESAVDEGSFVEFVEANDAESLARARARAGQPAVPPILTELDLS